MEEKHKIKSYETDCHLLRVRAAFFSVVVVIFLQMKMRFSACSCLKMMVKDVFRQIRRIIFMMNEGIEEKQSKWKRTININKIFSYLFLKRKIQLRILKMVKKLSFTKMVFYMLFDVVNKLNC